jgi:hypothetical protein
MVEHVPNHYPIEEAKFISPFVSPKLACETEHIPSSSLKPKSCPSSHPNVVLPFLAILALSLDELARRNTLVPCGKAITLNTSE